MRASTPIKFQYNLRRLLVIVALAAVVIKVAVYFTAGSEERIRFELDSPTAEIFIDSTPIGWTNQDLSLKKISSGGGEDTFLSHRENEDGTVTFLLNGEKALRFIAKDGKELTPAMESYQFRSENELTIFRLTCPQKTAK